MGIFAEQICYCGNCGKVLHQILTSGNPGSMIPRMALCSDECRKEITERYVASILGRQSLLPDRKI